MKGDPFYIRHILDSIHKIEKYPKDVDFETFSKNDMMCGAVVKELEVIGEAAPKCSQAFTFIVIICGPTAG